MDLDFVIEFYFVVKETVVDYLVVFEKFLDVVLEDDVVASNSRSGINLFIKFIHMTLNLSYLNRDFLVLNLKILKSVLIEILVQQFIKIIFNWMNYWALSLDRWHIRNLCFWWTHARIYDGTDICFGWSDDWSEWIFVLSDLGFVSLVFFFDGLDDGGVYFSGLTVDLDVFTG